MDVTKANFEAVYAEVAALLPTASFVAIDEEMSGFRLSDVKETAADTPAERFRKVRESATRFNIIQFGLAIFHETKGEKSAEASYDCRCYNFFLFPEEGPILMEAGAVKFNADNGLDWNRWIREGVPFVPRRRAEELRAAAGVAEKKEPSAEAAGSASRMVLRKQSDIDVTNAALEKLKKWLDAGAAGRPVEGSGSTGGAGEDGDSHHLITTNPYLRRFMHEALSIDFAEHQLVVETEKMPRGGLGKMMLRRFGSQEAREKFEAEKRQVKLREAERKLGFFRVYELLVESKKPVVGHAVMGDLLFLLSHCEFGSGSNKDTKDAFPTDYSEFKQRASTLFPRLYDTQWICKHSELRYKGGAPAAVQRDAKTGVVKFTYGDRNGGEPAEPESRIGSLALGRIHEALLEEPAVNGMLGAVRVAFPDAAKGYAKGGENEKFHEAGYDAYVTGEVFAMLRHIHKRECASAGASDTETESALEDLAAGRFTAWQTAFQGFNLRGAEEMGYLSGKKLKIVEDLVYIHARVAKGALPNEALIKALYEHLCGALGRTPLHAGHPERSADPLLPSLTRIDESAAFAYVNVALIAGDADREKARGALQGLVSGERGGGGKGVDLPDVTLTSAEEWLAGGDRGSAAEPPAKRQKVA